MPDLDVGRDEVRDGRAGAAEEKVLGGGLQVVVDDLEGAGPTPDGDRLGVVALGVEVGEVGVHDGRAGAVGRETAEDVAGRGAVDVAAVEGDVVRQVGERGRGIPVDVIAEQNEVGECALPARPGRGDLDADEAVVMGPEIRAEGRQGIRADDLRHEAGLRGADSGPGRGKTGGGGGADIDPLGSGLRGQGEVADEGGARLELDDVTGVRLIQGRLQIATRVHGDELPRARRGVGRVEERERELREALGRHRGGHRRDLHEGKKSDCDMDDVRRPRGDKNHDTVSPA